MPPAGPQLVLNYIRGGVATYLPGESFGPRALRDYELVWIIEGDATYSHDGVSVPAPAGTVILGRPSFQERYAWDRVRQTRHAYFHFGIERLPDDWPPADQWPIARQMESGDLVRPLFRRVLDRWCSRRDHDRDLPTPAVNRLVATLLDEFLSPSAADHRPMPLLPEAVTRAVAWAHARLLEEPDAPISLPDLASAANLSPSQLIRQFRATLGVTPVRTIQLMRLEQAMTLLARSNLTVKQIAARCGFVSQFHFSRLFHRVYGASPTEVRERVRNGAPRPTSPLPLHAPTLG